MSSNNRDRAESILQLADISEAPVNLEAIAKVLNIKIVPFDFPDKRKGMVYMDAEVKAIGISKSSPLTVQRFTIAHEFGHYLNGHAHYSKIYEEDERYKFSDPYFQQEREADMFAAELLMPKKFLLKDLQEFGLDTKKLTDKYQVSEQALHIRLSNLNLLSK